MKQEVTSVSTTLTRGQERLLAHAIRGLLAAGAIIGLPTQAHASVPYIDYGYNHASDAACMEGFVLQAVDFTREKTTSAEMRTTGESSSSVVDLTNAVKGWYAALLHGNSPPYIENIFGPEDVRSTARRTQPPSVVDRDFMDASDAWDFPVIGPKAIVSFEAQITYRRALPPKVIS